MYDIAIIGLGPAGAILARHLKNFKIVAIDKKNPAVGEGFKKPCGGMLAPDAQKAFSQFDMSLPKDILVDPQIFSVRTIDVENNIIRHYQRHYINMDRDKFDKWLISLVPENVEIHPQSTCTNICRVDGGFSITFIENHETKIIKAKYIVGADGASSAVRRMLYPNFKIHTYLSIQQWFHDPYSAPFYSCVFDPDTTSSYAWGLTKDDYFIFGGAFDVKTGKNDFERLKGKLKRYGFHLYDPVKTEACLVLKPFGPRNYCYGDNGAFLIGEAAGFISPSSLEGISYAIESGYILSQCLNDENIDPNFTYRKKTRKIRMKLFLKYLKYPFMYNSFLRKIVMKTGIAGIKVINGD